MEFKEEDGRITAPNGCSYENLQEASYHHFTDLCGCGRPEDVHALLIDSLMCFEDNTKDRNDFGIKAIEEIVKERPSIVAEFIAQFLDQRELIEHGGSVFGSWPTRKGEKFIEIGPMEIED